MLPLIKFTGNTIFIVSFIASIVKPLYGDGELVSASPDFSSQRQAALINSRGRKLQRSTTNNWRLSTKHRVKTPITAGYYQEFPKVCKSHSKLDGKAVLGDVSYTKKCNEKRFAVIQLQSLFEAADEEYQKSKLESRTNSRSHRLETSDVLKWTMCNIRGGPVLDWLAGKSRVHSSTKPPCDNYSNTAVLL